MSGARDIIGRFYHGESDFTALRDELLELPAATPGELDFLRKSLEALHHVGKLSDAQRDELLGLFTERTPEGDGEGTVSDDCVDDSGVDDSGVDDSDAADERNDATILRQSTIIMSNTELSEAPAGFGSAPARRFSEGGPYTTSGRPPGPSRIALSPMTTSERSGGSGGWSNMEYDAERPIPVVGDSLKDRFVLAKMVGQGGMGLVYKALDLRKEEAQDRDPYLAVKILSEKFKKHPDSLIALQREARKSQALAHPNVVNVFDFDRDGDTVYMTMEFLDGLPLDILIERRVAVPITVPDALDYIKQISAGLAYAHARGVVHSDLKPGNIFLTDDGTIKIIDFGIARATQNVGEAKGNDTAFDAESLGALTPAYASLDMLIGAEPHPSDDIYALGCIAYELLSGRHPFDKKPANKAYTLGMSPRPLTNINRSQWRAITSALAFRREDRVASVEDFVKQLEETWVRKWGIQAAAGVAAATIVVAVGLSIPGQLKEQELRALNAELASGDAARVFEALDDVAELDEADRRVVLAGSSNALLRFFEGQASAGFMPERERYDYNSARSAFEQALELYAFNDAAVQVVEGRLNALETRKNQLLNSFDAQFNDHLATFESGDYGAVEDLFEVLAKVEEVDPEHPLLSDGRLPPAFAGVARDAVDAGDYDQARALLNSIIPRFPEEATLREELGRADLEEKRVSQAVEVFLLEAEVAGLRSSLRTVDALPTLGEATDRLAAVDPGNSELGLARRQASIVVADAVDQLLADFRFADAQQLLEAHATYMDVGSIEELKNGITAAKIEREATLTALLADVRRSAAADDIGADSGAGRAISALEEARADSALLQQARAVLFEAYVRRINLLRSNGEWDAALAAVTDAYAQVRSGEDAQRLVATSSQIERARAEEKLTLDLSDRETLEQQRLSDIDRLSAQFAATIADRDMQLVDIQAAVGIIEQLAAIDPGNAIVVQGRDQIAARLAQRAAAMRNTQQYAVARQIVNDGLSVLPESESLSGELREIAAQEQLDEDRARDSRIAGIRDEIEQLLTDPAFGDAWNTRLRGRLDELEAAGAVNTEQSAELRQRIAATFADGAVSARQESRFADARRLIEAGRSYQNDYPRWASEISEIRRGEEDLLRRTELQAQTARVDGLKQTLSTQARALDVQAAADTLARLRELAPDDAFVTDSAPAELAGAYLSLATMAVQGSDFERAASMAGNGLELSPASPDLKRINDVARRELLKQAIIETLSGDTQESTEDITDMIETVRELSGPAFLQDTSFMTEQIARRLAQRADSDPRAAQALLAEAITYFPGARALQQLKLD